VDPNYGSYGVPDNSTNPAGYMDLSYWQSRHDQGLPGAPGVEDMFNIETGQLNPGWSRTERGYERTPVAAAAPAATPYGGGTYTGSGGGGGNWGYLTEPFTGRPPAWQSWQGSPSPTIQRPPDFSYKQFEAPTKDSIYSDPSYQFREEQGRKALEQSAAGRGVLRTGGTLKNLVNYGQNAASQEYSNIFGRAVDAHNLGLTQALGTYGTNWGVSRDVLDREIDIWGAKNDSSQRENQSMNQREFDNFLAEFDIFERNRRRAGDYLLQGASMGGT